MLNQSGNRLKQQFGIFNADTGKDNVPEPKQFVTKMRV
jgi:hypothetical protein